MTTKTLTKQKIQLVHLIPPQSRKEIWQRAKGIWKNRKSDPIQELKRIHKEWDHS